MTLRAYLRKTWRQFARDRPGERFMRHYRRSRRHRSIARTVVRVSLGAVLLGAGAIMPFTPGPGWLCVFLGLALLSGESRSLAGELVLTVVAFRYALSRAYGASRPRRDRVGWLEGSIVWFHFGLVAVALNLVLLTTLVVLGRLP